MIRNPIDAFIVLLDVNLFNQTRRLLIRQAYFDILIVSLHLDWNYDIDNGQYIDKPGNYLVESARKHLNGKPPAVCWHTLRLDPEN